MTKFLILFASVFILSIQSHADIFNKRPILVLEGGVGSKLFGPFASRMEGRSTGKVCSRLYGMTGKDSNQILAACKVCYNEEYTNDTWPDQKAVSELQLRADDTVVVTNTISGGSNFISEAYGCSTDQNGKSFCHGDNIALQAKVARTGKRLAVMCTSDVDLSRSLLNQIFSGVLSFPDAIVD